MFACELEFHDGVSPAEVIFVRRPFAIIGASDYAHVLIEGTPNTIKEVRIVRGLGRSFRCEPLHSGASELRLFAGGEFQSEGEFDLGGVTVRLTALDVDLHLKERESMDQAGVRILRRALGGRSPVYPAVAVLGTDQLYTSFAADEGLLIGRSRSCGLRLDGADVSSEHARVTLEKGRFYIEDLGSTNGTFINSLAGERVTGRRVLEDGDRVCIGSEVIVECLNSDRQLKAVSFSARPILNTQRSSFPSVISFVEAVRPSRFAFNKSDRAIIGRDPTSDIWVAASHISRSHAELERLTDGSIRVTDLSSNGTYLDGKRLVREESIILRDTLQILDLNSGITLGVCFSKEDEVAFLEGGVGDKKTTAIGALASRVLTPLEQAALDKAKEVHKSSDSVLRTQVIEKPPESVADWKGVSKSIERPAPPKVGESPAATDASGFNRLAQRDNWGVVPRGSGEFVATEGEESDGSEFEGSLLLYDEEAKNPVTRSIFYLAVSFLIAILAYVVFADFGQP